MKNQLLTQTPSQTAGPFFAYGILARQYGYDHGQLADNVLYKEEKHKGERILIKGQVLDGEGKPIDDAFVEIRQGAGLDEFGRMGTGTEADHSFIFDTYKPKTRDGHAPSINVVVLMRGLLSHVFTRIYFEDETDANARDPILNCVPEDRRNTLLAKRTEDRGQVVYRFDIHMQGLQETVFFDA